MNCEVCGKEIPEERQAIIADAKLTVCETCAKFGKELPRMAASPRKLRAPYAETVSAEEERLAPGWGERIRKARENLRLTQEEFAKKISEKAGIIKHIEGEKLRPEDAVARKIEKALSIKLKEKIGAEPGARETRDETLTLGDMIKIKKRKH